ncbi:MAG TPA: extracellular solute-binding protein, partial [Spirochaetia bacterium]|nr:extracellular solute-binding protein [Spirochaetia bacterium]
MKKIRIMTILLLSLMFLAGIGFAGGQKEGAATQAEKVQLDFWSWRTEDTKIYNDLIAMFQKENPGISVKYSAYKTDEWNTIISAAMKGGTAPDIVHLRAYGGLEQYAAPGYLVPLDDKVPALKNFSPVALSGVTARKDGKMYGVPFATQTLVIFYNKKIYDELGLKEPETWDDFLANLKAVKNSGRVPLANGGKDGWMLEVMHGVICPNFYGANDFFNALVKGETNFMDERYRKSLEKLMELRPYMPENFMGVAYTDTQMLFINEMAAHFIGGIWEAGYFKAQNPNLKFDVFAGPAARKGDTRYVSSFADGSYGVY